MKSFKAFLNEESVSNSYVPIDEEKLITLANTRFSEAFKETRPYIVRGMNVRDSIEYYEISNIKNRVSANTSNEYTVLIDNHPKWKKYPKRSESLICATIANVEYATNFGGVYLIIPENGAKIGICPAYDFWESFKVFSDAYENAFGEAMVGINRFNSFIRNIAFYIGFSFDRQNTDYQKLVDILDEITNPIHELKDIISEKERQFLETVISGKETMLEFCFRLLDPVKNDFKLINYSDLRSYIHHEREVWFSAPSLALRLPTDKFIDSLVCDKFFRKIKSKL